MKQIKTCDNSVVWAVSTLNESTGNMVSKYSSQSLSFSISKIKEQMWRHFLIQQSADVFYVLLPVFYQFCMYFYVFMFVICVYLCCFGVINE